MTIIQRPWTPGDIDTDLDLWLDADDPGMFWYDVGISHWHDKSGKTHPFSQSTGANQPTYEATDFNSKPCVKFNGSQFLQGNLTTGSAAYSVYMAVRSDLAGNAFCKFTAYTGLESHYPWSDGTIYDTFFYNGRVQIGYGANSPFVPRIYNVDSSAAGRIARMDGAHLVSSAPGVSYTNPSNLGYSSSIGFVGVFAEFIIFTSVLSQADREKIEGYLAHKWGMEANLATDHPYKDAALTIPVNAIDAIVGRGYAIDTTSTEAGLVLPPSPENGDVVGVTDYAGTFGTNFCSVDPNGNPLLGSLENRVLNQNNRSETYKFVEDAWVIIRDNGV